MHSILLLFVWRRRAELREQTFRTRILRVAVNNCYPLFRGLMFWLTCSAGAMEPPFYADKTNLMVYIDAAGAQRPVKTVCDWERRREHILANMQLVMGSFPAEDRNVPLALQVIESENLGTLTRKKISYASDEYHRVPAYLLIPANLKGKAPAMLCLHGTGGAMGRVAGIGADYPRYALELARRGYITIAPDCPLFGENMVDLEKAGYVSGAMQAIWDHKRAVDVLLSLPDVDAKRLGCIGMSLGGHNALFVAVFDQRLKVIVSSVGFDSFMDYKGGDLSGWCQRCYMPRIEMAYGKDPQRLPFDFPEVLAALAPRALYVHAPRDDSNFSAESARRCVEAALPVYRLFGAENRIRAEYPSGGHDFPPEARESAYRFIDAAFGGHENRPEPMRKIKIWIEERWRHARKILRND